MARNITILGSSGSIGKSTLEVVRLHPDRFRVFALAGHTNVKELARQCRDFSPRFAVVGSPEAEAELRQLVPETVTVMSGPQALKDVASAPEVDSVMAAIVGAAGLMPTLAAVQGGKQVLLANKEALVMAGRLFMDAVASSGAVLLPIDSEHNAIFQCLPAGYGLSNLGGVNKIVLSASGGPFRETAVEELDAVTPEQACAHPNWSMGQKISVDSATMMNKGLEVIEACWLFNLGPDRVDVVIHPQSIIHSLVSYVDGSMLAQLGNPDMRTPIAHALGWPDRISSGVDTLDLLQTCRLEFQAPDERRFPCLALARQAAQNGRDYAIALNAANEIAVDAFLAGKIPFTAIARVVAEVLNIWQAVEPADLEGVQQSDLRARKLAAMQVETVCR
jgi:1-deoxy-D-xylulose-5-phosphate reductoisomerase